jgi:hypothetical protein
LLDIFDCCRKNEDLDTIHCLREWNPRQKSAWKSSRKSRKWKWYLLAHVCHRWRQIVFASPRRLNLRIPCTRRTPVTKNLGIWPAFPIDVDDGRNPNFTHEANVLAALRYIDRVYHVRLSCPPAQVVTIATAMQEPFPMLTQLYLTSSWWPQPVLPAGFLGGSAPCLQAIGLFNISYPALPTLLLSTKDLVKLHISHIPRTSNISPEAMVASLVALPKLEIFVMKFLSYDFRPDQSRPPPVTRTILPALAFLVFEGASEYLEDLVGRIDGPRLKLISITTWYRPVGFQVAQLSRFIDHSVGPKLVECRHGKVSFSYSSYSSVALDLCHRPDDPDPDRPPIITYELINCRANPISQVFSQFPVTLSNVIHLQVTCHPRDRYPFQHQSVDFLHQFSAVQTLLVTWELVEPIASMLEHLSEVMVTEMLPSLKLICFCCEGPVQVKRFVAARRHSNRPVTVVNTRKEFRKICESYFGK